MIHLGQERGTGVLGAAHAWAAAALLVVVTGVREFASCQTANWG